MNIQIRKSSSRKKQQYITVASMSGLLAACGSAATPTPTPTNVTGDITSGNDVIKLGGAGGIGIVDALAGDDTITGGAFADFIRGNEGVDNIQAGAGVDNIVVIGRTSDAGYTLSDIQNPNGTGIDLSTLLSLAEVNNHAVSDVQAGEVIDGGADGAILFVYGTADFTGTTLTNITKIDIHSEVTFSAKQLKALIDSGTFKTLTGDGSTQIIITNDGSDVELDFSSIDVENVNQLTIPTGVTVILDQDDVSGLKEITGAGNIKAVTGTLDLSGVKTTDTIGVQDATGNTVVAAPPHVNSPPTGSVDIDATAKQGVALTADVSNLGDIDGFITLHYQWKSGADNVGSDSNTYTPVQSEWGKTITVVVTYTDNRGTAESIISNASTVIATVQLSSLDGTNGFRLDGKSAGEHSGYAVSTVGDVNADGYDDLIIGAYGADNYFTNSGSSYLVYGKATGSSATINLANIAASNGALGFRLDGQAANDLTGRSVSSAGDVNGDGYDDLVIGTYATDFNGGASGSAYIVYGKATGSSGIVSLANIAASNGTLGFRLDGQAANYNSGGSVSSAGDVNGDGYDDLIIGAQGTDFNGNKSGSAYIVYGKATGSLGVIDMVDIVASNGALGFRLDGEAASNYTGGSASSAGDVNGDGYDDLIIGAGSADINGNSSGSAYIVYGKATGTNGVINLADIANGNGSGGFRLDGELAGDQSGFPVSSAGDVNGDGYDDLIIGAYGADINGSYSGSSYVVYGKATGSSATINLADIVASNGSLGFRLDGEAASDFSGWPVSSAGDINGDGYDDLLIGAAYADFNGAETGSSYVVFGKATGTSGTINLSDITNGDGSLGFRLDGETTNGFSGTAVSSAGDVNNDGYDDLLIGAQGTGFNGTDSGSNYIVYGGAQFSTTAQAATLGDDTLTGTGAANTLNGGAGNDIITAAAGDDILIGGIGTDTLTGGTGADHMSGGGSLDSFIFAAGDSVIAIGGANDLGTVSGYDIIDDFTVGNGNFISETFDTVGTATIATSLTGGVSSTLTIGGNAVQSHAISNGVISFDDQGGFATALDISTEANIAAILQYLQANDLGNAGSTVAFDVGADTFLFTQGDDAGTNNLDVVVRLEDVQIDSLITTNGTGTFDLFIA